MPHNVAPINAAVYNKSKAAFRLPTVRRAQRYKEHKEGGLLEKITDINPPSSFVIFVPL